MAGGIFKTAIIKKIVFLRLSVAETKLHRVTCYSKFSSYIVYSNKWLCRVF